MIGKVALSRFVKTDLLAPVPALVDVAVLVVDVEASVVDSVVVELLLDEEPLEAGSVDRVVVDLEVPMVAVQVAHLKDLRCLQHPLTHSPIMLLLVPREARLSMSAT